MKLKDSSYDYGVFIKFFLKGIFLMIAITLLIVGYFKYIH